MDDVVKLERILRALVKHQLVSLEVVEGALAGKVSTSMMGT